MHRPLNPDAIWFHSFDNCFEILSVSAVCIFPIVESNSRFASSSYSLPLQAFTYTMIRASFKLSRNSGSFWIIVEILANRDVRIFFPSKFKYSPRWSFVPWHPKYAIITITTISIEVRTLRTVSGWIQASAGLRRPYRPGLQIPWGLRLPFCISEVCSPTTKAVDVRDDFRDGNVSFKRPERRGPSSENVGVLKSRAWAEILTGSPSLGHKKTDGLLIRKRSFPSVKLPWVSAKLDSWFTLNIGTIAKVAKVMLDIKLDRFIRIDQLISFFNQDQS